MKKVSVVVSTYTKDRLNCMLDCIDSLNRQSLPPKEVILVLDPDQDLIEFYESRMPSDLKIVVSKRCGLSNARNVGVKNAEGEIVAFIDDDALADKDWLRILVKHYDDKYVVGTGGLVKPIWESNRPSWFPEELDWIVGCSYKGAPQTKTLVRNPLGCNMSFRKTIFEKVGLFNNSLGRIAKTLLAGEETEFSIRIHRLIPDAKILFDPTAVVYHKVPKKRTTLKYIASRSLCQGIFVSQAFLEQFKIDSSQNDPKVEQNYLNYLLTVAIPKRLRRSYNPENVSQIATIFFSTSMVAIGYIMGRLSNRN